MSPHFYDHLKGWSEGASGGLNLSTVGKAIMHCQKVQGKTMRRVRDLPLWDSRG